MTLGARTTLFGAAAAYLSLGAVAAAAQTASETPGQGDNTAASKAQVPAVSGELPGVAEIIVTARKREEGLRDVPVAVSVLGGSDVAKFNLDKPADLISRVPSLNIQVGGTGAGAAVSLRGVGTASSSAAFDSAVALNFDGIQFGSMRILQSSFFDVQRIEVLKGPQALFFGKGSSAGVLSLVSNEPTRNLEVGGKAGYEFEQRGLFGEIYVSGPVADGLGVRVAARYSDVDRIVENSAPGTKRNEGERNLNLRGIIDYSSGPLHANLKLNYVQLRSDLPQGVARIDCGPDGVADPVVLIVGNVPAGYGCNIKGNNVFLPYGAAELRGPAFNQDFNSGVPFSNSNTGFGILKLDFAVAPTISISSTTGYIDQSAHALSWESYGGIVNGRPYATAGNVAFNGLKQFSEELRISTKFDFPVNFVLGGYYEDRTQKFNTNQDFVNISLIAPDPVTGVTLDSYKEFTSKGKAHSLFGQGTWDITDRLELTGGVRWTKENKRTNFVVPYTHALLAGIVVPSGFRAGPIRFRDNNLSPEATLKWMVNPLTNLYVAYKTGFKSGGLNNSALPTISLLKLNSPDAAVRSAAEAAFKFKSEKARGGEIGVKTLVADRKLALNASIFLYRFNDLQIQTFDGVTIQFVTTNAGQVTSKGADLDFSWVTPVSGLRLNGSIAYTNTKYSRDYDPNPFDAVAQNLRGRAAQNAPKWSGNFGADFTHDLSENLDINVAPRISFTSDYITAPTSFNDVVQNSFVTADFAISVGRPSGEWRFALIGNNMTDERPISLSVSRPFLPVGGDDRITVLGRGRTVTLQGSFRF